MNIPFHEDAAMVARMIVRLEENCIPVPECGCWLWTGHLNNAGYGRISINGKQRVVSRAAYEAYKGIDPGSLFVCHKCDTRSCINPDHLFLGDNRDNVRDMYRKGRRSQLGSRNGNALLTEAQVLHIINSDAPRKQLATDFGLSVSAVDGIKTGVRWKHLQRSAA